MGEKRKLHQRAEQRLLKGAGEARDAVSDLQRLVHELRVYQVELETQNEELIKARSFAEHALIESEQARRALYESEERYRYLFENITEEVHYWALLRDDAGNIVDFRLEDINPAGLRRWGKTGEEVIGQTADEIFPGAIERFLPVVQRVFRQGVPYSSDFYSHWGNRYLRMTCIPCGDHFITTGTDITEIKQVQAELEQALAERIAAQDDLLQAKKHAEAANNSKTKFLAAASHDLRQPMAAIELYLYTLSKASLNPKQSDLVVRLRDCSKTLNVMLNTLLDISKLDTGGLAATFSALRASELFIWIENEFSGQFNAQRLHLDYFYPHVDPVLYTDFVLLKGILVNLLGNALKYCNPGKGRVLVALRRLGHRALLQVWDNGIGIAPEHLERIFEEYYQVANPEREMSKGLGLGLSIVARKAKLIGAEIECRSQLGKGSVFGLWLPLAGYIDETQKGAGFHSQIAKDPGYFDGKNLLLIEDNAELRAAMVLAFQVSGMRVMEFADAESALANPDITRADFYISDFRLPGEMNGLELLDEIERRTQKPIKGILMTGDMLLNGKELSKHKKWTVLTKPCPMDDVLEALAKLE